MPASMIPTYSPQTMKNFVVVEGLDGAGTSTQATLLTENLNREGTKAILSWEPTSGPIGTLIKQIMRGRLLAAEDRETTERQLAYLFAADRHDHLHNQVDGITSQTRKGFVAVSTRYFFSSYAYNARTEADFDLVDRLNRDFPVPQAIVYLKVPLNVALERLGKRDVREFYEHEAELKRVAGNFDRILEPLRGRVVEVETNGDLHDCARKVLAGVKKLIG
ncbi:dTMP kinase [Candidatus Sumerlaeota bacterium]|nr:dTMP kinase [Candidatus Sumerlaeota bacterium]